jgi:hypothetical protein
MKTTLLALAAAALFAAQDKAKIKLAWNLPKGRVAEYKLLDKSGKPVKDGGFWIFASELSADGSNRLAVDRYADIPYTFLFTLPKEDRKQGESWEHTAFFFHEASEATSGFSFMGGGGGGLKPLCAKGLYIFRKLEKKADGDIAHLEGVFELFEIRRDFVNNERKLTITKNKFGTAKVSLAVAVAAGRLLRGGWTLDVRGQERVPDKGDTRIVDTKIESVGGLEFSEEVTIDPEKLGKSVADQVKKASDWLRKQQRPGGEFGLGPTIENARVDANLTGACVRALVAAGAKPDDAPIEKAMKSIRAQPGTSTASLGDDLEALALRWGTDRDAVAKALSKDDAAAVKVLANTLAARRDVKLASWGSTDDKDATHNPVSTSHALAGLWAAGLGGADVPVDIWKNAVETLTLAIADDDAASLELKFEFAEGGGFPVADGAKNAKPVTWKYDLRPKQAVDPRSPARGWGLTVLGALESLRTALLELERKKQLTDAQKRSADSAMRQGLAYLQNRWTVRTAPPAEASWTIRRTEWLAWLGRVYALYGVKTVDGHDWWLEGAYHLLRLQAPDGSWEEGTGNAVLETAAAIRFLARSR